jgi:hypothetical protein
VTKSISKEQSHFLVLLLLALIISPVGAIIIALTRLITMPNPLKWQYYSFFVCLALWLGCINATKTPESDLERYIELFQNVPERSFTDTVLRMWETPGKDIVYSFIVYIGYYICLGKASLFFCLLTVVIYMLQFVATYRLFTKLNAGKGAIICGVMTLAFFTQYFNLTAHMVRQVLATSIMIYALTLKTVDGKHRWWLLITAVLTHVSVAFLVVLSIVPCLYKKLSFSQFVLIQLVFIGVIFYIQQSEFPTPSDAKSNIIELYHLTVGRLLVKNNVEEGDVSYAVMMIILLPLAIVGIKKLFFDRNTQNAIRPVIHILFLLILFVITAFPMNSRIQQRFFYYTYSFIPLLLPLAIEKEKKIANAYYLCISSFFVVRFLFLYDNMVWIYAPVKEVLLYPCIYLLAHSDY